MDLYISNIDTVNASTVVINISYVFDRTPTTATASITANDNTISCVFVSVIARAKVKANTFSHVSTNDKATAINKASSYVITFAIATAPAKDNTTSYVFVITNATVTATAFSRVFTNDKAITTDSSKDISYVYAKTTTSDLAISITNASAAANFRSLPTR